MGEWEMKNDEFDAKRFIDAQKNSYDMALAEIKSGRKQTHWMWYIFPQISGLGKSTTSDFYAIKSIEETICFLSDPYLGKNLTEISTALLSLQTNNASEVFDFPDDKKLKSSMTLFASISDANSVFQKVLDKFFGGKYDKRTLSILSKLQ